MTPDQITQLETIATGATTLATQITDFIAANPTPANSGSGPAPAAVAPTVGNICLMPDGVTQGITTTDGNGGFTCATATTAQLEAAAASMVAAAATAEATLIASGKTS